MISKRDQYTAKTKHQLDLLNEQIDALEAKTHEAKVEARDAYRAELAKLRKQSATAMSKLDEIRVAGEDAWDKMVAEMEKVRDAFSHSFNYFKSQI